jgi:hypothetical protein
MKTIASKMASTARGILHQKQQTLRNPRNSIPIRKMRMTPAMTAQIESNRVFGGNGGCASTGDSFLPHARQKTAAGSVSWCLQSLRVQRRRMVGMVGSPRRCRFTTARALNPRRDLTPSNPLHTPNIGPKCCRSGRIRIPGRRSRGPVCASGGRSEKPRRSSGDGRQPQNFQSAVKLGTRENVFVEWSPA